MSVTKNKPHKAHKPAKGPTVKARKHRLHVPPGGAFSGSTTSMSQAMVDRLFWRAGFGPTAADRAAWIGQPLDDAVDSLLNTPQGALIGPMPWNIWKISPWVSRRYRVPAGTESDIGGATFPSDGGVRRRMMKEDRRHRDAENDESRGGRL